MDRIADYRRGIRTTRGRALERLGEWQPRDRVAVAAYQVILRGIYDKADRS